ncbi:hypothetical protein GCM10022226_61960 [Sphaerisporangium flaviroseum]|uniref:Uncharacterized protein n=1 Tax=Sphaerisporangium flaviroseum TaxID=509199 RepID=A0ABP7J1J8_9ACTN
MPCLAQRVTVLGSTRNMEATSAGVSKGSEVTVCVIGVPFDVESDMWWLVFAAP